MRWYLTVLCCFGIFANCIAQIKPIIAEFDLERNSEGLAVIKGKVKNKMAKAITYSYSMKLNKVAASNKAISTQSGSFTLLPQEEKIVSEVSINLGSTASFEIVLKVFDDENIVAEETLLSDQNFIKQFQKLLPKKTPAIAETPKPTIKKQKRNNTDAIEIDGLIIDETRSKNGRDYYDLFYSKWIAPGGVSDFSIVIRELPARGRGARIAVEVNGNVLFQRFLQPRYDMIELLAEQSVNTVKKYLIDNEKLKNDLSEGDAKGSGIY